MVQKSVTAPVARRMGNGYVQSTNRFLILTIFRITLPATLCESTIPDAGTLSVTLADVVIAGGVLLAALDTHAVRSVCRIEAVSLLHHRCDDVRHRQLVAV